MKKMNKILWGIVLVAVGVLLMISALGIADINVFFDGWWTLFIILPCAVGVITEHDKTGNLIGLAIGVFLLLCAQDILSFDMLWKLLLPVVVVIIGVKMIFGGIFGNRTAEKFKDIKENGANFKNGSAIFTGQDLILDGEVFEGAELTAVFGGVKCDLRNAVIEKDCIIEGCAVFGGIDILVPENVNVKINSTALFGGISDKKHQNSKDNTVTLYLNGTAMFGGIDVK